MNGFYRENEETGELELDTKKVSTFVFGILLVISGIIRIALA